VAAAFLGLGKYPMELAEKARMDLTKRDVVIEELERRYVEAKEFNNKLLKLCKDNGLNI